MLSHRGASAETPCCGCCGFIASLTYGSLVRMTSSRKAVHLQQRRAVGVAAPVPAPLAGQLLKGGDHKVVVPRQLMCRQAVATILAASTVTDHVHP